MRHSRRECYPFLPLGGTGSPRSEPSQREAARKTRAAQPGARHVLFPAVALRLSPTSAHRSLPLTRANRFRGPQWPRRLPPSLESRDSAAGGLWEAQSRRLCEVTRRTAAAVCLHLHLQLRLNSSLSASQLNKHSAQGVPTGVPTDGSKGEGGGGGDDGSAELAPRDEKRAGPEKRALSRARVPRGPGDEREDY
ncbi:hypothetical protein AAFF_G00180830 [Aldrovandia affinis]|uniref:Uncharacterized protein n=1 Tax=Aldrovandia affinis TaxID=143900 RepID=A0AAD7SZ72_9TELE|nr:hypothetical protein AAFF_G00180830 [Aldrovandia affinis]